ncbi:hypothetical protein P7C73_g1821, partial [Tremellales sp. Uapishka_1]
MQDPRYAPPGMIQPFSMVALQKFGHIQATGSGGTTLGFGKGKAKGGAGGKEPPLGKVINMGKKKATIFVPTRYFADNKIRLDKNNFKALFDLCFEKGYIQYPIVYENMRGLAVQKVMIEKYEKSARPVKISASFWKWAQLHPSGHHLHETSESHALDALEIKNMYLDSQYVWMVTKSSNPNQAFIDEYHDRIEQLENGTAGPASHIPSSDHAEPEDEEQSAFCENCGTKTSLEYIQQHEIKCTGKKRRSSQVARSRSHTPTPAGRGIAATAIVEVDEEANAIVEDDEDCEQQLVLSESEESEVESSNPSKRTAAENAKLLKELEAVFGDHQSDPVEPNPPTPPPSRRSGRPRPNPTPSSPAHVIPQTQTLPQKPTKTKRTRQITPAPVGPSKRGKNVITSPVPDPPRKSITGPVSFRGRPTQPYLKE